MILTDYAYDLLMEGFNPLPLKDNKAPLLEKGHKYLYELVKEDDIPKLFEKAQKIGIACGKVSDGFYCLDFDAHNSEPIENVFNSFIDLPYIDNLLNEGKLSIYSTAGGGYHIYFIYRNEVIKGEAFAHWQTKSVMIEIRGDGQYCACYPSNGYTHIKGQEYIKLAPLESSDEFQVIKEFAHSFNQYKEHVIKSKTSDSNKKWAETWVDTTPDGKYNLEYQNEAKELLSKAGWQYCETRNQTVDYWTRPNKDPKDGFSATFGHFVGMFYIFSEDLSCKPFVAKQAYSPFNIYTELKHDGDWKKAKDELRKRFNMVDDEQFWSINEKGSYSLNNIRFKKFLESNDFFKNSPNEGSTFDFIQKQGIFMKIVYEKDIKDFVIDWIEKNQCNEGVFNLMTGNLKFFKRDYLSLLKSKPIDIIKDTKDECYLFYRNCVVKVTKTEKKIMSYNELKLGVWRDQVINRDYIPTDHHESEYRKFIWKIAGEDKVRYKAFQTVIGYLLHSFKTNSNNKAIIFNDEVVSENPNGRSGKGLFWNALKQLRKVQSLDGKTFDFAKSFPYQSVSTDCQVLVFDDVKKSFNFENLFSVITEGITIEYKGKDSIKLDVTESPKVIITTNYTIQGDSASFNARKYEVEMSSFFSDKHTPIMEFGHELFNDWTQDEWSYFDNYMMNCISIYLTTGLVDMPTKNLNYRKLIDIIGNEMNIYFSGLIKNEQLNVKKTYDDLLINFPELRTKKSLTQNLMTRNLQKYCEFYNYSYDCRYSGGIGKFTITAPVKEQEQEQDVWDDINDKAKAI
jgi:hypothetical protein